MSAVPCPRCGAEQTVEPEDAGRTVVCWRCAEHFPAPGAATPRATTYRSRLSRRDDSDDRPGRPRRSQRPRPAPVSAAAVVSFALGVLSCLMFCVWPVTLGTSVAGIITGAFGCRTPSRRLAVAGVVFSAVALVFAVGFMALTIAGISVLDPAGAGRTPPPFFPANP